MGLKPMKIAKITGFGHFSQGVTRPQCGAQAAKTVDMGLRGLAEISGATTRFFP